VVARRTDQAESQLGNQILAVSVDLAYFDGKVKQDRYYFSEKIDVLGPPAQPSESDLLRSKSEPKIEVEPPPEEVPTKSGGLVFFLIAAGVAAFFMVLTPCVFP